MDKYQEALDNVKIAPSFMGGNTKYSTHINSATPFSEDISTLQELVDKETPKKTIKEPIIKDAYRQYKNYCPICKQELLILGNYCLHCGQAVDWGW